MKAQTLKILAVLTIVICNSAFAQKSDSTITVYGTVVSSDSLLLIPNTHVINKNSFAGTVSNGIGEFLMNGKIGDTLVFSNVSFQFYYYEITGKEPQNLIVKLKTRNYLLDEVSISAYKLTSNEPRTMPVGKPFIPSNDEIVTPHPLAPTLANPVDFLYYLFSKRPEELRKLRQLYAEEYYRRKLEEGNNREILVALTGLPREELEAFMFYCKFADTYINTLNDYEFLISLLDCYDQFEREQTVQKLLEEQEVQEKIEGERFRD